MVEHSMYWNNRGAGINTIGGYSDLRPGSGVRPRRPRNAILEGGFHGRPLVFAASLALTCTITRVNNV